jgi:hypothetical protein
MLTPSQIAGLPLYRVVTVTLAAGEERAVPYGTNVLALITATNKLKVEVRFSSEGDTSPLYEGVTLDDLKTERFWLKNTDAVDNTITVATGAARFWDNRLLSGATATDVNLTKLNGGSPVGQQTMAGSIPVVIASNQTVSVGGSEGNNADGEAVKATGLVPVDGYGMVYNGTTWDRMRGVSGRLEIASAAIANGAAIGGAGNPILNAGSDGANLRTMLTDSGGRQIVVGAVAAGSAIGTTAPVLMGGSDGTNVQRIAVIADNVATPAAGNQTGITGLYSSTARALTSARVAFLSIDRGGKVLTTPCGTLDPVLAGYTVAILDSAATTNATSVKAAAGMVYEVSAVNNAAYDVFIKLHNKASAPTVGTDIPYRVIRVPAGQDRTVTFPGGAYFATGVAYAVTKLVGKLDTTAVAAGDLQMAIQYA